MKRSVLFLALALMLAGCRIIGHADVHQPVPAITIDAQGFADITFQPYAEAVITDADLSVLGQADGDALELVTDRTAYSIAGVDPTGYVALAIDRERWDEYVQRTRESEPDWSPSATSPTHQILISMLEDPFDGGGPPETLCAYLDPTSDRTPPECQGPITIAVGGQTYQALVEPESRKVLSVFTFVASDLEPAGAVEQVDPRLSNGGVVGTTAYRIPGAAAADGLVVSIGSGPDQRYALFLPEGSSTMPPALCGYVDPGMAGLLDCGSPSGGETVDSGIDK